MVQFFLIEASDYIEKWESVCFELEKNPSPEKLNELFRMAHNLKGSAKSVGLMDFGDFVHKVEDVITLMTQGKVPTSFEMVSELLQVQNLLSVWVQALKENPASVIEYKSAVLRLNVVAQGGSAEASQNATGDDGVLKIKSTSRFVETSEAAEVAQAAQTTSSSGFISIEEGTLPEIPEVSEPPVQPVVSEAPAAVAEAKPATQGAPVIPIHKPEATPMVSEAVEHELATAKKQKVEAEPIRISISQVDNLLNLVGELVVNKSIMTQHRINESVGSPHAIQTLSYMEKLIGEIQDLSFSLRMVSVKPLFQRMKRIVRDLSKEQHKEIEFVEIGEDVEFDKTIMDRMVDPLVHIIRNAIDHGIENSEGRTAAGKPAAARISLDVKKREDTILIRISDDGKGLDRDKILAKAISKNIISAGTKLSDDEVNQLIFEPGFSTKEVVTDVSGRGVGMDIVRTAVQEMKGTITIETEKGKGTTFMITLPLSLSIISGMVVNIHSKKYIVPINQLVETIDFRDIKTESSTGVGKMFNLRGDVIPIYSLGFMLGRSMSFHTKESSDAQLRKQGLIAICKGKKISFEVDEIVGLQYVVLKKLGREMQDIKGIIGGTILGDGEPGLILNLNEFVLKGDKQNAA